MKMKRIEGTEVIDGGYDTVSAREIRERLEQGRRMNVAYNLAYKQAEERGAGTFECRRAGAAAMRNEGRLYSMSSTNPTRLNEVHQKDRTKIAKMFGHLDIKMVEQMQWATLQALATNLISEETRIKIMTLGYHHYVHPDCPNKFVLTTNLARYYAHQPTDEKNHDIDVKYALLKEELLDQENNLGELTEDEILWVQQYREDQIREKYAELTPVVELEPEPAFEPVDTTSTTEQPVEPQASLETPEVAEEVPVALNGHSTVEETTTAILDTPVTLELIDAASSRVEEVADKVSMTSQYYESLLDSINQIMNDLVASKSKIIDEQEERIRVLQADNQQWSDSYYDLIDAHKLEKEELETQIEALRTDYNDLKKKYGTLETQHDTTRAERDLAYQGLARVLTDLDQGIKHAQAVIEAVTEPTPVE